MYAYGNIYTYIHMNVYVLIHQVCAVGDGIYIYTYIYIYISIHMDIYIYISTHVCIRAHQFAACFQRCRTIYTIKTC